METLLSLQKNELTNKIYAVFLCAGRGSRLGEKTKSIPKPLITNELLDNKPILFHSVDNLGKTRIKNLVFIKGYLGNKIEDYILNLKESPNFKHLKLITIDASQEYKKGPFYSFLTIKKEKSLLQKKNIYLILPGDTIFYSDFYKFMYQFILRNTNLIYDYPIVFYRTIETKKIKLNKPMAILRKSPTKNFLERIFIQKSSELKNKKKVNLIFPSLLLTYNIFSKMTESKKNFKGKTIREWLNLYSESDSKILVYKLPKEFKFLDIDSPQDLKLLKKKNGQ